MSARNESKGPPPKLTEAGIRRLIAQMDRDMRAVAASTAPDALKRSIGIQISQVKINLRITLTDPTRDFAGWVVEMGPQFEKLTHDLVEALGSAIVSTGSCSYSGGCFQSTRPQCEEIGGSFSPGGTC